MGLFSKCGKSTLSKGKAIKDLQRSVRTLAQETKSLGARYRLFLPVIGDAGEDGTLKNPGIASCLVAGRTCDYDCLGTSFFTYTEKDCVVDEGGKIKVDNTNLGSYARIANALFNARMNEELLLAEEEWKKRKDSGEEVTEVMLEQKKQLIIDLYTGKFEERRAAEVKMKSGNKSFKAPSKLLGRIGVEQGTVAVLVELDSTNKAKLDTVKLVSIPSISNQRSDALSDYVKQPNCIYIGEHPFMEVEYNVIGGDIDEAKRNAKFLKVEVGAQSSAFNMLTEDEKATLRSDIESKLIYNEDEIQSSIMRYDTTRMTAENLESLVKSYLKDKRLTFAHLDPASDVAKWAAKDMKELNIFSGIKNDFSGEDLSVTIESLIETGTTDGSTKAPEDNTVPTQSAAEELIKKANLAEEDDLGVV